MNIALEYLNQVRRNCTNPGDGEEDLIFWRNKLFFTTIIYLLPLSLIALVPGLYWVYKIERYAIGIVDIMTVASIVIVGFVPGIPVVVRKIIFISCAYIFSCAILYYIGLNGPGLIYLLTACLFSILIFSTKYVYWSAWLNTFICAVFALLIGFNVLEPSDARSSMGEWIAVSTNLIFLSFLCVALIPRLFKGLQKTIKKEIRWKKELADETIALNKITAALQLALNDNNKTMDSSLDVICAVDEEGRFIRVSAACEEVWGYTAQELIGKRTMDFVYSEDRIKTRKVADDVRAGISAVNFENRYVHKNGSLVPISWSARWDEKDRIRYAVARNITEKKKLENAFEVERQHFYDLFLEAPMSIGVVSGPNHIYEVVNPPYLELIQKTDIIGKTVQEVLPEIVAQGFIEILDAVYETGESFSATEMLIKLDIGGKVTDRYLNFNYQAHRGLDHKIDGVFFFSVDVTEQVLLRKTIEVSESRLNEAQAIAMLGNWEVDMVNNIHYWSDEVYEIFGVSKDDVNPNEQSFMAFVHPNDLDYAQSRISKGFEKLENITFYFRFIRKDGSIRHGYNEWKFKFDTDGKPLILSGILQDVTERKETEQHLKNSEAFSRGVLNSLTSNIAVIDFSGNLIAINESWKAFSIENGAPTLQGTGIGSNYFDVCEKAAKQGVKYASLACEGIKDVMNDRKNIFYLEYECHSLEVNRWFGMRVMKFEGNEPLVVISHHDISERKFAEFASTKVARDLILRNKDLEQFTYIVSHNLRAPVANILGLINVWDSPGLNKKEKEELQQGLFDSVNKLDDVVKDLNQILQVRGAMTEKKEKVRFSQLVEDIKISIKSLIDIDVIEIKYDFSQIDQMSTLKSYIYSIFYNLITNSIKYRQHEIPCLIEIKTRLINTSIELIFKDNGMGIDLLKRGDQVFGLYKRFHPYIEGKGLGLFMVKTQVEKLGGRISIISEVNKGTEFKIELDI